MGAARKGLTYAEAGVDIDAGDEVVDRIEKWVKRTHSPAVLPHSHGAFGGFFRLFADGAIAGGLRKPVLVGATDGVGTKLKIAFLMGRFGTVGIDLVAMSVNDLVVGGAQPLFFLDYIGTSAIEPAQLEEVVRGVAEGCVEAGCALLGGETAELPGFYRKGEFDLAGFAVGLVDEEQILDGAAVRVGDSVIGLASTGLHSNGFSLARKALLGKKGKRALTTHVAELGRTIGDALLEPTRIYVMPILTLLRRHGGKRTVHALAHITGGGLVENIPRVLPEGCAVRLERRRWDVPPIFRIIQKAGRVEQAEMDRVFNNGLGMIIVAEASAAPRLVADLEGLGQRAQVVGEVVPGRRAVEIV